MRLIYLHGLPGGGTGLSPALAGLSDYEVVTPVLPGFDGKAGFEAPSEYLDWLTALWDAVDATGALPCPVVGASLGGMLAAELAVLRPEAVTKLALLGPLGLWDDAHPGIDFFTLTHSQRLPSLFTGPVPDVFAHAFADVADADAAEGMIANYLSTVAAVSLMWPLPDHGLRKRLHRLRAPTLVMWGADDRIAPVQLAERWPAERRVVVPDAGHLVEWDAPDTVTKELDAFLHEL
jgi:pimeloyl-ACP methyl ester carboxylesterase